MRIQSVVNIVVYKCVVKVKEYVSNIIYHLAVTLVT